jgi:hypothetical protein
MPLQNRVTPWGELVAVEARGLLMGNRGCLHDGDRRIVRYAQGKRWIACVTSFKGRRRTVMSPGSYTELFFLDEAVALAAGHRPCAECRRPDYLLFQAAWTRAALGDTSADAMDHQLHTERLTSPRTHRTYDHELATLPDATFVAIDGSAWLIRDATLHAWTPAGYTERRPIGPRIVKVITPRSLVEVFRAGYRPLIHPTAE